MFPDFTKFVALISPFLPFITGVSIATIAAGVPLFLMRLQGKKLKAEIAQLAQSVTTSKTTAAKEEATALETLNRVAATTAEELEKSLQKSVTIRNLLEKVEEQKIKIEQLVNAFSSEHEARLVVENQVLVLQGQLATERAERQTAVAEIDNLKASSGKVIQNLTARVKILEGYIRKNGLTVPNGSEEIKE